MQISKYLPCTDFSRHTAALIRHCRHLLSASPDTTPVFQGSFNRLPPVEFPLNRHPDFLRFAARAFVQDTFSNTSMDLHHTLSGYEPDGLTANGEIFAVCIFVDSMILPLSVIITEKKLRTFLLSATFLFYKSFFY